MSDTKCVICGRSTVDPPNLSIKSFSLKDDEVMDDINEYLEELDTQATKYRCPASELMLGESELFACHYQIGDQKKAQGDMTGALESFKESLRILQQLVKADSDNSGYSRNLWAIQLTIGEIFQEQGDLTSAIDSCHLALGIVGELEANDPNDIERLLMSCSMYNRIGLIQESQNQLAEALESFQNSLEVAGKLLVLDPENSDRQRQLMTCHVNVGNAQQKQNDTTESIGSYELAFQLAKQLVSQNPHDEELHRNIVYYTQELAFLYQLIDSEKGSDYWFQCYQELRSMKQNGMYLDSHMTSLFEQLHPA